MSKADVARMILRRAKNVGGRVEAEIPGLVNSAGETKKISASTPEEFEALVHSTYGKPGAPQEIGSEILSKKAAEVQSERILADKARRAVEDPSDVTETLTPSKLSGDSSALSKTVKALGYPQRKMLNAIAEKLGVKKSDDDSQVASEAIVEKVAEKLGVPEDSVAGNVGKALAVAGTEVFADPLNLLGVGPIAKGAKMVGKVAPKADKLANIIAKMPGAGTLDKAIVDADKLKEIVRKRNLEKLKAATSERPYNAAKALATKGAERIYPTHVVKSKP